MHREENVDNKNRLTIYINLLNLISKGLNIPIIFPVHPRTKKNIAKLKFSISKKVILIKPLGFIDFSNLEINSKFLITDSGTVQEEASILRKLCLVFREATERPETIENGDAIVINKNIKSLKKIKKIINHKLSNSTIKEYKIPNVSQIAVNIINSDLKN